MALRSNILATLLDGRTIASDSATYVLPTAGNYAIAVTIRLHRVTERMIQYRPTTNPICDPGTPTNEVITGNVVGFTLIGVGAGTTLTAEVLASGY